MEKKTDVGLPGFLQDIIAIAESGVFDLSELTDHPNAERGDVVIGEMTPFEKAANMVSSRLVDEHNNIVRACQLAGEEIDVAKEMQLKQAHDACCALLWASVYGRVDAEYVGKKWDGFALLEGGQIAVVPNRVREHLLTIEHGLESLLGALIMEGPPEHNCGDCKVYDKCNLPTKEPRQR